MRPIILAALLTCAIPMTAYANDVAPGGTLRAVYLGTNPAQAVRDPATGEVRGASIDLARELAKRSGVPVDIKPAPNPPAVIEAVKSGAADIGFVAYEATRLGTVEFSQTYMLVRQSFLVLEGSSIKAVADIDRSGQKIGGTKNDSITLCLKRILKQATPVELDNNPPELSKALLGHDIDALGANRQRLTTLMRNTPGTRLLPDNLFNVPQNIIVPMGRPRSRRSTRSSTTCATPASSRRRSSGVAPSASTSRPPDRSGTAARGEAVCSAVVVNVAANCTLLPPLEG